MRPDRTSSPASERAQTRALTTAIGRHITRCGTWVAHPLAFVIVGGYGMCWYLWEPESFDWHAMATLAVWLMTLFIQRVGHRDMQAIQAKLDELLHVDQAARNEVTRIDEQEPEDIERLREEARQSTDAATRLAGARFVPGSD